LLPCHGFLKAEDFPFKTNGAENLEIEMGKAGAISEKDKAKTEQDKLNIGGTLWQEIFYLVFEKSDQALFSYPSILWLYADALMRHDIRGFAKGRVNYDPTIDENAKESGQTTLFSPKNPKQVDGTLEELKLQFNIAKRIFITTGKQKIKWGSNRIWNPTDFLNSQKRDPLRPTDDREGVPLVKVHVPIDKFNLYMISSFDDAQTPKEVGGAGRMELAFSASEISLSAYAKENHKAQFGGDISFALGDFDVNFEAAYSKGSDQTFYRPDPNSLPGLPGFEGFREERRNYYKIATGIDYQLKYSDQDSVIFALEYFFNKEGYRDPTIYPWIYHNNLYVPYYLAMHYLSFIIVLQQPGSWNDFTFTLINLANVSDHSAISRLQMDVKIMQDLLLNTGVGYHYGKDSGEFKFSGQMMDFNLGLRINF
jgi:hypothetical protein